MASLQFERLKSRTLGSELVYSRMKRLSPNEADRTGEGATFNGYLESVDFVQSAISARSEDKLYLSVIHPFTFWRKRFNPDRPPAVVKSALTCGLTRFYRGGYNDAFFETTPKL